MKADRIDGLVRRVRELRLITSEDIVRTARGCRVSRITADRRSVFRPSAEDTECFLHSRCTGKRLSRSRNSAAAGKLLYLTTPAASRHNVTKNNPFPCVSRRFLCLAAMFAASFHTVIL